MSDSIPDPYLAQTGFNDDAWEHDSFEDLDADDELEAEEDRAREH